MLTTRTLDLGGAPIDRLGAVALLVAALSFAVSSALARKLPLPPSKVMSSGAQMLEAIAVLDSTRYRRTDAKGRFQFDSVSPGTHRLGVRSIGYHPLTAVLKVGDGTIYRTGLRDARSEQLANQQSQTGKLWNPVLSSTQG